MRGIKRYGLSTVYLGLFLLTLFVMSVTGHHQYNNDQRQHHQPPVAYWAYLHTGDFVGGVFENWESEFLQMGTYVLFTAYLFQVGSPSRNRWASGRRRTSTRGVSATGTLRGPSGAAAHG